jgi:hypothetical protein
MELAPEANLSPEVRAIGVIDKELEGLDEEARRRVLEWAASKYGVAYNVSVPSSAAPTQEAPSAAGQPEFETFADLLDAADPETEAERTLVGAYWVQVQNAQGTFTAKRVNDELKNTGHKVSNITRALDNLQRAKPALVRQIRKSGKSRQARKTYKLTDAGIRRVQNLIKRVTAVDEA